MTNHFHEGDIVTVERRPGLFRVEMPLDGVTWVRALRTAGGAHLLGSIDSFEWTLGLRRVKPEPLRAVPGRQQ